MSDQPKTLSDICARIRTIDESMMRDLDFIAVFLEFLPRDIEAAAERERQGAMKTALLAKCRVCEKVGPASAPGNAAAIRDALNRVGHLANDLRNITERDTEVRADVNEIVDVCRAALAAPARNCDRFKTMEAARSAFRKFCRENYNSSYAAAGLDGCDDCELCETKNMSGEDVCQFAWLFATAEGGEE